MTTTEKRVVGVPGRILKDGGTLIGRIPDRCRPAGVVKVRRQEHDLAGVHEGGVGDFNRDVAWTNDIVGQCIPSSIDRVTQMVQERFQVPQVEAIDLKNLS